ncbi:MAG TPA: molybdenum cofactor guanylyltransferase [Candidatus Acidoferrum sp.]|nr:molybdenum cofactor guanylyltransferase [Candidatus Acidoferrum sp.]
MERSVIILTHDSSKKFEEDKGLMKLNNKPLLDYVLEAIQGIAEEVIIVTNSKEQEKLYTKLFSPNIRFVRDADESKGLLGAALTGFEAAEGKYSLLLPFDSPLVSPDVLTLLFDCAGGKSAVVARSPDCEVEALHAVYNTKMALEAAKETLACGEFGLEAMIERLRGIRYMSTLVIEQLDPDFKTFFRIITPLDLKKAVVMLKPKVLTSKKGAAKAAKMRIRRPKKHS